MEILHPQKMGKQFNRTTEAEKGIGLIIFDLDGTVADTIESIREGVNIALKEQGYPPRTYDQIREAIGNGAKKLVMRSMPPEYASDEALLERTCAAYHRAYGETFRRCDRCYEGMAESLAILRERGYVLAMLSNKQDVYVKATAELLLPEGTFAIAEGQKVGVPTKPDPTVPLSIAARLGFSPEQTAFVGDSEVDVQTALNAGMLAVGCSWGYRDRSVLIETGADVILDRADDLCRVFC